jgi:hypothetical protein
LGDIVDGPKKAIKAIAEKKATYQPNYCRGWWC